MSDFESVEGETSDPSTTTERAGPGQVETIEALVAASGMSNDALADLYLCDYDLPEFGWIADLSAKDADDLIERLRP